MELNEFSSWLNALLTPEAYNDFCVNGLCVEAGNKVSKVVTGVSLCNKLIERAIEEHADCLIVHHPNGFWKGENQTLVGRYGKRMRDLFVHGISLYGFHLPLDGHAEIGNNAVIAKSFGLEISERFMFEGEHPVGVIAEFEAPIAREAFYELACGVFEQGVQHSFFYGKNDIQKVGICSGSGASGIEEAIALGCDAFITGDIKEAVPILVEELGFNLITAGHHRTEIFGVKALAEKIQKELSIDALFVDLDNPI